MDSAIVNLIIDSIMFIPTTHENAVVPLLKFVSWTFQVFTFKSPNYLASVADPVGSPGRPRTTHKFGPKFYYYSSETGPRSLSSQTRPKAPQIHELFKKIMGPRGIEPGTSCLRLQYAYQSSYESLLDRWYPQPYLIRENREKYPLINHFLVC